MTTPPSRDPSGQSEPGKREITYRLVNHLGSLLSDVERGTFTIERVEVLGRFATRAEARQYMITSADERKARDA